ncbi:cytoplasmic protein [Gallid alphaherpesvirus 2]|uniref:Cytoplasmic protein n=1 Tax=Gallid alphaherpesvirus 2 TaxID=10390 RepID=I6TNH7_9ALPH|nr:cytoplasmic protein [synthetic construct]AFM74682.1 cytoplasmic protein [Gallid alphaherpesvirus 2]ACR02706.1 cytoplasmic protein [synthetic construct]ACR03068.1 cytoplasmic protein [synthetic construct]ACR03072.1 cytoplasmic protein [synthetic construct]
MSWPRGDSKKKKSKGGKHCSIIA